MSDVRNFENDDGKVWGWINQGVFRPIPKPPLLLAGLGPPPFDVTLPTGEVRSIIHAPVSE